MALRLLIPYIPQFFRDLRSQFRKSKRYDISNPVFDVPIENHGLLDALKPYASAEHIHAEIRGSFENRVLWSGTVRAMWQKHVYAGGWRDPKPFIVKVGHERFIYMNPPRMKARPFPNEEFHLHLHFPNRHVVKIPYYHVNTKIGAL